jgi:tetratricopeptide (TPR) repeat protein
MHSSDDANGQGERIPQLAPGWAPEDIVLTPAEGFLISRIDGRTPWAMLRQIGGLSPEQVDDYLDRWIEAGAIRFIETNIVSPRGQEKLDIEAAIDASLDISEDFQRRILEYETGLDRSYHELLGVERGADTQAVKRAYFALSKQFHPDRYFRKNMGTYAERLGRVFRRMVEAYEMLSDPTTRAELERSMEAAPPPKQAGTSHQTETGRSERIGAEPKPPGGYRTPTRMENLERLRGRFKIPKKLVAERQLKARQLFQAAQVSAHQESWLEAAASVRLAIAFDPWNVEYKDGFARIQMNVHGLRAKDLLEQAKNAGSQKEALRMLEEAVGYRPMDPQLNARAARLSLELGELDHAREYAETVCEIEPDEASHHAILCRVLRRLGRVQEAREALERAASLDANNSEVKVERLKLRGQTFGR